MRIIMLPKFSIARPISVNINAMHRMDLNELLY